MKRGKVHSKDKRRVYIEVAHKTIAKDKRIKHLFPGKTKKKIIPVKKRLHHKDLKKGDRVKFEMHLHKNTSILMLYFSLPIIGIVLGYIIGLFCIGNELGTLSMIIIFGAISLFLKRIIRKKCNIFKEIKVKIHRPESKIYRAKKRKKSKINKIKKTTKVMKKKANKKVKSNKKKANKKIKSNKAKKKVGNGKNTKKTKAKKKNSKKSKTKNKKKE